jgi:enoyl-CoA hydratase/carnithine racemase
MLSIKGEKRARMTAVIGAVDSITLRLLKRGVAKSLETSDMEQQLRYELSNIRIAFSSEDAQEARKAFFEKTSTRFQGKVETSGELRQPGRSLPAGF